MDRRATPLNRAAITVDVAIAQFGADVAAKLHTGAGSPEDHLRTPLEGLIRNIARASGEMRVTLIGETRLPDLSVRPDFAVEVDGGRVGYIELKRPWPRCSRHVVPSVAARP